jgi:FKBP-type peptidyl-prolyl cis-trans isomerase SlyD
MKVEKNKVISVSYELRINGKEGEIADLAYEESPLNFIYGLGLMLPKFEDQLENMNEGEKFEFMIKYQDGYGERNEDLMSNIPKQLFEQNGKIEPGLLAIGNLIPMQDEKGKHFEGKVISVIDETVKLDFNHPLAGENLYFVGKILNIREATQQELDHGHVHSHDHDHH